MWAGAFDIWGLHNKEAAIRISNDSTGTLRHWEIKIIDATANMYLAIGAVIVCGLDGIRKQLKLKPPVNEFPDKMSAEERIKRNINLLPQTLFESIGHLSKDEVLLKALGDKLSASFLAVKKYEESHYSKMGLKEEVDELFASY